MIPTESMCSVLVDVPLFVLYDIIINGYLATLAVHMVSPVL